MKIGYARVSTADQNLDMQRDALTHAGCEKIFEEKKSGKAGSKRPELEAALAYLRPEDVLVVWKASLHESGESVRHLRTYGDHAARMEVSRRSGLRSGLSVGVQM